MNSDARASRSSMQRTASVSRNALQSGSSFADPPVALQNLDELRASDVLVRAYYNTLAVAAPPLNPPLSSLTLSPRAAAVPAEAAMHPPHAVHPSSSIGAGASPATSAAEARAVGEVICASLARDVVEAAASLYTSRRLNDLVETYTACATWDDARDAVAGAFLPQDLHGNELHTGGAATALAGATFASRATATNQQQRSSAPIPVFMRSALSLAGVATRTPTCTLTPQSSLSPPPLGTPALTRRDASATAGPTPPASVPMDVFSRYVTVVEEEAPTPTAAAECPSSPLRAPAGPRTRAAKGKTKNAELGAASSTAEATAATAGATLAPSPPMAPNAAGKRGTRVSQKRSLQPSQASFQQEVSLGRGKTISSPAARPPSDDPLTRALRQGLPNASGDGTAGVGKGERLPARPAGGVGLSSTSFPSVAGGGGGEAAKKAAAKQKSPSGGVVVAVERDQLWNVDRSGKTIVRGGGQRKDGVRCHVVPSEEATIVVPSQGGDASGAAGSAVGNEANAKDAGVTKTDAGASGGHRRPPPNKARSAATLKTKKGAMAEREAWTASFFSATDAAGETSLQDQVQVTPSPGVTVVVGGTPSATAAQGTRRGLNGAAAGANSTVVHGGDFAVPADRLALSAFEEKRVAVRKSNGPGRLTSPATVRPAQVFRTV
jgi:hypothetical protein